MKTVLATRPEPRAAYGAEDFAREFGASPAQMADMDAFRAMLAETNAVMNLVGPATLPDFWSRHARDSAQLLNLAPNAQVWADLGAGAGFPGVVLAILLKGREGGLVHLIDSLSKRCRFLQQVVDALDLPARVHDNRAENLKIPVDIVTARAVAPLIKLLGFARPYFALGAEGLFLKGESAAREVEDARPAWRFDAEITPSISDSRGQVVRIRRLSRVR